MLPDKDDLSTYGGALKNYSSVVDPTTDEDVAWRNKYACNVAMSTHTITRAIRSFVGHATTPTDPGAGFVHDALWGNDPSVKATVAKGGTGIYDLEWPTTVDTPLTPAPADQGGGQSHTLNFQRAWAQVESADGTFKAAAAKVTGANTVRVYTYDGTTLDDLAGLVITVWVY